MILTIIIFLITFLILVVSHEFGHFLAAKKFGVRVLEFGFGLPPKIFGKIIDGTEFTLNLLPIGGFVRLFGEDETDKQVLNKKDSFAAKKVWQRMIIVTSGVIMNILLAAFLFYIVLIAQGFKERIPLLIPFNFVGVQQSQEAIILISDVVSDSPSEQAGLRPGDQIAALNGQQLISGEELISLTQDKADKTIILTIIDPQSQSREVAIVPRSNPPQGQGPLGIEMGTMMVVQLHYATPLQKITAGFAHGYNLISYSLNILGKLISASIVARDLAPVSGTVSGPVGITSLAGAILKSSSPFIPYLNFIALLSLNLAIINILPFPALDGGRLIFLIIEMVVGRKVKAEIERTVHAVGMIILIGLILLITFSDIQKLIPH